MQMRVGDEPEEIKEEKPLFERRNYRTGNDGQRGVAGRDVRKDRRSESDRTRRRESRSESDRTKRRESRRDSDRSNMRNDKYGKKLSKKTRLGKI